MPSTLPPSSQESASDLRTAAARWQHAASLESPDAFLSLVNEGVPLNTLVDGKSPSTPLALAIHHLSDAAPRVVRCMLARGADPNFADNVGRTALFWASSLDVARLLLRAGANINQVSLSSHEAPSTVPAALRSMPGATPLHTLLTRGWKFSQPGAGLRLERMVSLYLEKGADVTATTEAGLTPLHVLAYHPGVPRKNHLMALLVAAGANPHALSRRGNTVLTHAASFFDRIPPPEGRRSTLDTVQWLTEHVSWDAQVEGAKALPLTKDPSIRRFLEGWMSKDMALGLQQDLPATTTPLRRSRM